MKTSEIVRLFHGKRSGNWKGRPCYLAKCPSHKDRTASLSITQDREGATYLHCFRGCTIDEIMGAKGLSIGDLFETKREMTPELKRTLADEDRLKVLELREGVYLWLQCLDPANREYWTAAEKNNALERGILWRKLNPIEAARIRRESETQRIIRDYGFDELWRCVP